MGQPCYSILFTSEINFGSTFYLWLCVERIQQDSHQAQLNEVQNSIWRFISKIWIFILFLFICWKDITGFSSRPNEVQNLEIYFLILDLNFIFCYVLKGYGRILIKAKWSPSESKLCFWQPILLLVLTTGALFGFSIDGFKVCMRL